MYQQIPPPALELLSSNPNSNISPKKSIFCHSSIFSGQNVRLCPILYCTVLYCTLTRHKRRSIACEHMQSYGLVVYCPILLYNKFPWTLSPAPCLNTAILPATVLDIQVSVTLFFSFSVRSGVKASLDSNTAHSTAEAAERFNDSTKPEGVKERRKEN